MSWIRVRIGNADPDPGASKLKIDLISFLRYVFDLLLPTVSIFSIWGGGGGEGAGQVK
jgi:hypothetical protein